MKNKKKIELKKTIKEQIPFEKLNMAIELHSQKMFLFIFLLCLIFSIFLFNVKIDEGGDDSTYIEAGYKYAKNFANYYFSFNAPLYPMFLSIPIKIFGINLILLKCLSIIFTLLHLLFFYLTFRRKIDNTLLFTLLILIGLNSSILYFASQTYTEAFFLFLQSFFFYSFALLLNGLKAYNNKLSATLYYWILTGFAIFLLSMAKNIAIIAVPAFIFFFIIKRQWLNSLYALLSYLLFKIPFELIKYVIWGNISQFAAQGADLLQKDPYLASEGKENLMGFVTRFIVNAQIYLSSRFFQIMGFVSEKSHEYNILTVIIIVLLLIWALYQAFKCKNDLILFSGIYTSFLVSASFIALHVYWSQTRLILIFVPLLLLMLLYGIYEIFRYYIKPFYKVYLIFASILILFTVVSTIQKSKSNFKVLKKNIKGDIYNGYTPDWQNYLQMSEWCGENLKETDLVACRKPSMSFIYSKGKPFYGIYKVPSDNADTLLELFKKNKVTHVLMGSLRQNPDSVNGKVISTVHNILHAIQKRYPDKLNLIHSIENNNYTFFIKRNFTPKEERNMKEGAYLFKIEYDK
jgi:hypothetical protein